MARKNTVAENAAVDENVTVDETAAVEKTAERTYTQEELDAILTEKLNEQQASYEKEPDYIQDNLEGEEMTTVEIPRYLGPNDDPRGEYVAVNGVAMFVPRGKVCKIKKKFADRLLMSLKLREKEESYIRENEGDKEVSL